MQVGTTKDQGLNNKPSAAVCPGALAAGTLPHNIISIKIYMKRCSGGGSINLLTIKLDIKWG